MTKCERFVDEIYCTLLNNELHGSSSLKIRAQLFKASLA